MAGWEDVRRLASGLPGASEQRAGDGTAQWRVSRAMFVWERPLRRGDLAALGEAAPPGPVIGVRVADLGVKQALLADGGPVVFGIPHLEGYPAVLVQLDLVDDALLQELVVEAWRARAGVRLLASYDAQD